MESPRVVSREAWPTRLFSGRRMYNYLDLTPLGRQRYVTEFPYHDTYNGGS